LVTGSGRATIRGHEVLGLIEPRAAFTDSPKLWHMGNVESNDFAEHHDFQEGGARRLRDQNYCNRSPEIPEDGAAAGWGIS
jgi:hypothetical protein